MGDFTVKFWGVRGTIPTPNYVKFGGNTSCVEVIIDGKRIILDAGTGLNQLGNSEKISDVDILLSHTHIDHIIGFPFFKPLYNADANVRVWTGNLKPENNIRDVITTIMSPPVFPLSLKDMKAKIEFYDFTAGEEIASENLKSSGITIKTLPINHPDRATAYRIECKDKALCYVTDVELGNDLKMDEALTEFVKGCDILIHDATYTDETFEQYKGWGHSTWQQALRLAKAASAKRLVAFHHDPEADDITLDKRDRQLSIMFPGSFLARERTTIEL